MEFRKPFDENTWHWHNECPNWPHTNYGASDTVHSAFNPATDIFCPTCRSVENTLRSGDPVNVDRKFFPETTVR